MTEVIKIILNFVLGYSIGLLAIFIYEWLKKASEK